MEQDYGGKKKDSVPLGKFNSLCIMTMETLNPLTGSINTRRVHKVRLNSTGILFHHTYSVYPPLKSPLTDVIHNDVCAFFLDSKQCDLIK